MKRNMFVLALAIATVVSAVLVATVRAEDAVVGLTGTVVATLDEQGAVTAVSLVVVQDDVKATYAVALDENGKKLAALNGKLVKVVGTVVTTDAGKTVTVTACAEVKAEVKAE